MIQCATCKRFYERDDVKRIDVRVIAFMCLECLIFIKDNILHLISSESIKA